MNIFETTHNSIESLKELQAAYEVLEIALYNIMKEYKYRSGHYGYEHEPFEVAIRALKKVGADVDDIDNDYF